MHVAMIGAGYVGLVTGACFAEFGHVVTCIDNDRAKVAALKRGEMPIFEPGLAELVARNVAANRLSFTTELAGAAKAAEAVFIAVGTPSRQADGLADLTYVYQAAREIAAPPRRLQADRHQIDRAGRDRRRDRPHRPRAAPGRHASPSSPTPSSCARARPSPTSCAPTASSSAREDARAQDVMRELYRPLVANNTPIVFTERRGAELIKYAANAFLATKITFINEIADLCEQAGANVQEVARGIGLDNRIGPKFLNAGPGYGGSCFPKDLLALLKTGLDFGVPIRSIETIISINEQRKRAMARKVIARAAAACAAAPLPCSASPSSPIPTTCARRPRSPSSPRCRMRAPAFACSTPKA